MYVEPPAAIAIIGAGPIGLEAALYARFLGYNVKLFERGSVAEHVMRWGHVKMFSPFQMNASTLGLQALAAQDESYQPPEPDEYVTGREWVDRYLLPLAQSDLIVDGLCEQTRVIAVTRRDFRKGDLVGKAQRMDSPFRLLVEDQNGQRDELADVVLDTSGTFGNHNWLGAGGAPAVGETLWHEKIEYGLPDILGAAKAQFADRRTLVIGSGYSAATNVVALAELHGEAARDNAVWITRAPDSDRDDGPLVRIPDDRLPARDALAAQANALANDEAIQHFPDAVVTSIAYDEETRQFSVAVSRAGEMNELVFGNILANVGYRPDGSLHEELQVQSCYASGGPMKLAAALLGETSSDCLDQSSHGPGALLNPEPNFYILGSKSYGRNSNFLVSVGLAQIRDVFSIIGDREDLNLYATMTS